MLIVYIILFAAISSFIYNLAKYKASDRLIDSLQDQVKLEFAGVIPEDKRILHNLQLSAIIYGERHQFIRAVYEFRHKNGFTSDNTDKEFTNIMMRLDWFKPFERKNMEDRIFLYSLCVYQPEHLMIKIYASILGVVIGLVAWLIVFNIG